MGKNGILGPQLHRVEDLVRDKHLFNAALAQQVDKVWAAAQQCIGFVHRVHKHGDLVRLLVLGKDDLAAAVGHIGPLDRQAQFARQQGGLHLAVVGVQQLAGFFLAAGQRLVGKLQHLLGRELAAQRIAPKGVGGPLAGAHPAQRGQHRGQRQAAAALGLVAVHLAFKGEKSQCLFQIFGHVGFLFQFCHGVLLYKR